MKKLLIFIFFILLVTLTSCKAVYSDNAYFEVGRVHRTSYENVLGSKNKDIDINAEFQEALVGFSYQTASDLLEERNGMISPISFYIALSELVELTDTATQNEILNALKIDDIELLRSGNEAVFKKFSYENEISKLQMSNSIWLSKDKEYQESPLKLLRDRYYASSYGIDFALEQDKKMIEKWVKNNTGGNLGEDAFDDLADDTVFVLINTIYFYDVWKSKFDEDYNFMDKFEGLDEEVEYMNQVLDGYYFKNEEYESSVLKFVNGLRISFVAPLEGVNLGSLINNPETLNSALNNKSMIKNKINYSIPKYNYSSSFDLVNYAKKLGINLVFNTADFSPLTDIPTAVSKMYQQTFIQIDETGGKAGAYTAIIGPETSGPVTPIDFFLNRAFVYAIYFEDYPIFIGVVSNPNSNEEENYK